MAGDSVKVVFDAVDHASGIVGKIQQGFSAFNNVLFAAEKIAQQVGQAIEATVGETVKYANQVRELQMVSGQTAEESSRMIQVFDDFKLKIEELTPAIRKMTSEGLTPNLRTIAQLSDEYNKLATPLEKNKFLMDKFGRSGLQMAEMMGKGSEAILAMSDAVDQNLIMTQEAENSARQYELAMDGLQDKIMGVKVALGNQLIPEFTNFIEGILLSGEYTDHQARQMAYLKIAFDDGSISIEDARKKAIEFGIAVGDLPSWMGIQVDVTANGLDEIQSQIAELTNEQGLNFILDFQANSDKLKEDKEKILAEMTDLKDKIVALRAEMAAGTADKNAPEDLSAMEEQMRSLTGDLNESEAAFKRWQKQAVFSLIQTKLAAGGLSDAEFEMLLGIGKDLGLLDPATVEQATSMLDAISGVDSSSLSDALADVKQLVNYNGKTITIYVNQIVTTTETTGTGGGTAPTTGGATTTGGSSTAGFTFNNYGTVTVPGGGTASDFVSMMRG